MNAIVDPSANKTAEFEGVIREFARRETPVRRKPVPERAADAAAQQITAAIERIAGASFDEIDRVIGVLQMMKETLRQEGERVQREVVGYASLTHSAATSMKVIGESLTQWKPGQLHADTN